MQLNLKNEYSQLVACFLSIVIISSSLTLASNITGFKVSSESPSALEWELKDGEAIFWYLGFAGWIIKTRNHLLVFDYMEPNLPPDKQKLSNGFIDPKTLAEYDVTLFATHNHGDHWDPESLEWAKLIPRLKIVLNWPASTGPNIFVLNQTRSHLTFSDLEIYCYTHESSVNIPHSTILVRLDGVSFYTNGDFGALGKTVPDYVIQCLDYISSIGGLDILFLNMSGNIDVNGIHLVGPVDAYTIKKLNPRVTLPQRVYSTSQRIKIEGEAKEYEIDQPFIFVDKPGEVFYIKNGVVKVLTP